MIYQTKLEMSLRLMTQHKHYKNVTRKFTPPPGINPNSPPSGIGFFWNGFVDGI
jgi:hypothetical protein